MADIGSNSYGQYNRAETMMRSVSGVEISPREYFPRNIEEIIAGAAIALEKGHPNAVNEKQPAKATRWLDEKSPEGMVFAQAVEHLFKKIEIAEYGDGIHKTPENAMKHLVADTLIMASAERALDVYHEVKSGTAVSKTLTKDESNRVDAAFANPVEVSNLKAETLGRYDSLTSDRASFVQKELNEPTIISPEAEASIKQSAFYIEKLQAEKPLAPSEINNRIGNFLEDGEPLFVPAIKDLEAENKLFQRVDDLALSKGEKPMNEVEAGIAAYHRSLKENVMDDMELSESIGKRLASATVMNQIIGGGREMAEKDPAFTSPILVAMRIEGMSRMMDEAARLHTDTRSRDLLSPEQIETRNDAFRLIDGKLSEISPERQVEVFRDLHQNNYVPALKTMRAFEQIEKMTGLHASVTLDQESEMIKPSPAAAMAMQQAGMER